MKNSILEILEKKIATHKKMTPKQKAVLEAAISLFAEKGFSATSTSEIAKKAGVAEGTIFKHYETKEQLLYSTLLPLMLESVFPESFSVFKKNVIEKKHPDFETFITKFVDDRFAFVQENVNILKIILAEILYRPELKQMILDTLVKAGAQALSKVIQPYKKATIIVDWPDAIIMRTIIINIAGYCIPRFVLFPELAWEDEDELKYVKQSIIKTLKNH